MKHTVNCLVMSEDAHSLNLGNVNVGFSLRRRWVQEKELSVYLKKKRLFRLFEDEMAFSGNWLSGFGIQHSRGKE